jgi:hypothetical protein
MKGVESARDPLELIKCHLALLSRTELEEVFVFEGRLPALDAGIIVSAHVTR